MGRVLTLSELKKELSSVKGKVVFTNGCFDILHVGHARYLRDARALGACLVVGINADSSVRRLKGPTRPIQDEGDRSELLASLGAVDYVVIFAEETPLQLIEEIKPDVLVKGGDWAVDQIVGSSVVLAKGGEVKSLKFHPGRSTTKLLEKMESKS